MLGTEGHGYFRRKLAAGKSRNEALRCLKRRLSDVVYRCMVADARTCATEAARHRGSAPRRLHQFHAVGCVRIGGRIKEGLDVGGESGELPGGQAASGVAIGIVVATATLAHARTVESGRATVQERTARVWRLDTIVALPELLGLLSWQDVGSFGPLSYPYGPFSYCGPGVTESDPSDGPVGRRLAGFVPARDEASLSAKSDWRRR